MSESSRTAAPSDESRAWGLIFVCWLLATGATLGALFFSEVMRVAPCVLCWYQRIFMFPLVLVLPIGLFPFDPKVVRYALPLAAAGWLTAGYHQLVAFGVIPESLLPCTQGIPCAEQAVEWFGFVSIPTLSLLTFTAIITLLSLTLLRNKT